MPADKKNSSTYISSSNTSTMNLKRVKLLPVSLAVILLPVLTVSFAFGQHKDRQNGKKGKAQWISLFNGKNLDGWQIYGTEKWYVDPDGTMVCESGPDKEYGYLATDSSFKDFVVRLRFKQEANGNSGLFFHSSVKGTTISGWQAEIAPPGQHSGGIYESYGRGWLILPDSAKENALKMGEWNNMKVRVVGDTVDTWLNGTHMIHLVDEKIGSRTGQIALQIHSGGGIKVRWKNIAVRKL